MPNHDGFLDVYVFCMLHVLYRVQQLLETTETRSPGSQGPGQAGGQAGRQAGRQTGVGCEAGRQAGIRQAGRQPWDWAGRLA
jgi:hypothetical protein